MKVTSQITVDMLHPNVATLVYAKQTDQQSRFISATLLEGSQPWTPPTGVLAAVRYRKPDGTIGWYDTTEDKAAAVTMSGNVAAIQLAAQTLAVSGDVYIELEFYTQNAEKLSSFAWVLTVEASAVSDGEIESSDYFNVLAETIAEIAKALPDIRKADEYAQAAAQSATQAANSEAAAKASEQAAATSKTQAATSASNSAAAAQNSSKSAAAAKASADAAAASQQLAASNAQTANTAAASATAAEENAEESARDSEAWAVGTRDGQAVPASDETHNNNSKYWAQQAAAAAGGGVVTFNGRNGAVVPMSGDYTADMVGAQPTTNDLDAETNLADGDYIPFYDTSASAGKKTLWSNIVAKIRTALFGGAKGFLKANGSGVISATGSIGVDDLADGSVTRAKLVPDALCSPVVVSPDSGEVNISLADAGATFLARWTAAQSTTTYVLNETISRTLPERFEIAFTNAWDQHRTLIKTSGVRVVLDGGSPPPGTPQAQNFKISRTVGTVALKKLYSSASGDLWILTGPAEVVS